MKPLASTTLRLLALSTLGAITSVLPILPGDSASAATPHVGAVCAKPGKVITSGSVKYRCVKVAGKSKASWKRIATVAINSSGPGSIQPTPVPSATATKDPRERILFSAIEKLRAYEGASSSVTPPVERFVDVGFNQEAQKAASEGALWVASRYGASMGSGTTIYEIFANSEAFVVESLRRAGATDSFIASQMPGISNAYGPSAPAKRPLWGFSTWLNGQKAKPVLVYMAYPGFTSKLDTTEIGSHEFFHSIQSLLAVTPGSMPCWLHEGQASLWGTAFAAGGGSEAQIISIVKSFGGARSTGSDLSLIEAPSGWKFGHGPCGDNGEYGQGRIANALLIDRFGVEKSLQFLKSMRGLEGDGSTWKPVFESTFGMTVSDFYAEAAEYLKWFFKEYFGQQL